MKHLWSLTGIGLLCMYVAAKQASLVLSESEVKAEPPTPTPHPGVWGVGCGGTPNKQAKPKPSHKQSIIRISNQAESTEKVDSRAASRAST
jgi:hypothetical protein